ncbi:MAG: hypothetical protein SFV81_02100 [Pirellulaceae bacterium]|nr:hypothetical protein [Pirellulaceae bacterium]
MHTVDLLEEALALAERSGVSVRRQWLAEGLGGMCRIGAQRVLFVNLAASNEEQLEHTLAALRSLQLSSQGLTVSDSLKRLLG